MTSLFIRVYWQVNKLLYSQGFFLFSIFDKIHDYSEEQYQIIVRGFESGMDYVFFNLDLMNLLFKRSIYPFKLFILCIETSMLTEVIVYLFLMSLFFFFKQNEKCGNNCFAFSPRRMHQTEGSKFGCGCGKLLTEFHENLLLWQLQGWKGLTGADGSTFF